MKKVLLALCVFVLPAIVKAEEEPKPSISFKHEGMVNREKRSFRTGGVHFSPDGKLLATSGGYEISMLEVKTGKKLWNADYVTIYNRFAFSPDGKWLAVGGGDETRIFGAKDGKIEKELKAPSRSDVAWFGQCLAVADITKKIEVYDSKDWKRIFVLKDKLLHTPKWMDLQVKDSSVIYCLLAGERITEYKDGKIAVLKEEENRMIYAYNNPTGKVLLSTGDGNYEIRFFSIGEKIGSFTFDRGLGEERFSLDGNFLAIGGYTGQARIYDKTGKLCFSVSYGAGGERNGHFITTVDLSRDGKLLAIGGTKGVEIYAAVK